jgi:hypothetical protein
VGLGAAAAKRGSARLRARGAAPLRFFWLGSINGPSEIALLFHNEFEQPQDFVHQQLI